MTRLVDVNGLVKRFNSLPAVDDASLIVERGEVVGLLGANGAGKTTLIRCLLGLVSIDAGRVLLLGESPNRQVLRHVGYVPQGLGLYEDLTVAENLEFRRQIFGGPEKDPEDDGIPVGDLPRGRQRQASFEAALAHEPDLLILDEPTSGVGAWIRAQLWDTIREKVDGGSGALVTTHHLEEAEHCDRLVLMAAGRVVKTGSLADLIGNQQSVEIATEQTQLAFEAVTGAGMTVTLAGAKLRAISPDRGRIDRILADAAISGSTTVVPASLDEVFFALAANES